MWDRIEIERVMYGMGCTIFAAPYFMAQKKKKRSGKSGLSDLRSANGKFGNEEEGESKKVLSKSEKT